MLVLTAAVQDFVADDDKVERIHNVFGFKYRLKRQNTRSDGMMADNIFYL